MTKCRLKLIIYPAGARGDFVCGWAGLLPNVINNLWGIDPVTGISYGNFETKMLDYGSSLEQVLEKQSLLLDADSDLFLVGPCHGYQIDLNLLEPMISAGTLQLYTIDIAQANPATIAWEFLVKTYLSQRNTISFLKNNCDWLIDSRIERSHLDITDQDRIDAVTRMAKTLLIHHDKKFLHSPLVSVLDYTKLFGHSGSHYLCDQLKLSAPEICHDFWNQMLPFARSPDRIQVWNHVWNKTDFFKDSR